MIKPFFSVIIATHNRADLLSRAVESVLSQTDDDFELIIINDASCDSTESVVKRYDGRVNYIKLKQNSGLACARNRGIAAASGKWIVPLDDDDIFLPKRLELQKKQIETDNNRYFIYYCGTRKIIENSIIDAIPHEKGKILNLLIKGWTPPVSSQCFERSILVDAGCYDENLHSGIDHDLWFSLGVKEYETGIVTSALVIPNTAGFERMTLDRRKRIFGIKQLLEKWRGVIEKNEGKSFFRDFLNSYLSREYLKFALYAKGCVSFFYFLHALYYSCKKIGLIINYFRVKTGRARRKRLESGLYKEEKMGYAIKL